MQPIAGCQASVEEHCTISSGGKESKISPRQRQWVECGPWSSAEVPGQSLRQRRGSTRQLMLALHSSKPLPLQLPADSTRPTSWLFAENASRACADVLRASAAVGWAAPLLSASTTHNGHCRNSTQLFLNCCGPSWLSSFVQLSSLSGMHDTA